MIDLYSAPTPNGWKASIALEEMGLPYRAHVVDLMSGAQKQPEFLAINPNGRIPAIVDHDVAGVDGSFAVFESGALMIYLAEKSGQFLPTDVVGRSRVIQWLMFQRGGIGPMMGQANVFFRYFPEKIKSVIDRYQSESARLFGVLDGQLKDNEFLAGDYSIADMANWSWVHTYKWSGVDMAPFPNLERWMRQIRAREAVDRGVRVPIDRTKVLENADDAEKFIKGARTMVQGLKQD